DGIDGVPGQDGRDGIDGIDGIHGDDGEDGEDGKDGKYYYPGTDGYWVEVDFDEDGNPVEKKTTIMWKNPNGLTAVLENGVLLLSGVQGVDGGIVKLGLVTLNNLIVIPSYVDDYSGSLPVIDFSPLRACEDIVPAAEIRFRVSPSNVSWDQTVESIRLIYNAPKLRAEKEIVEITSTKYEDGILTVGLKADTKALEKTMREGKINEVQLAVKLKNGGEVFSDYVKLTHYGIIYQSQLRMIRKLPSLVNVNTDTLTLPRKAEWAKWLPLDASQTLPIVVGETIKLTPFVDLYKGDESFYYFDDENNPYDLSFDFDLLDENGKPIVFELGGNKTDQQKFIEKVEGTTDEFRTRVYDLDPNMAAVGRTPIVHVTVKSNAPGLSDEGKKCVIAHGFFKLKIVKEKAETAKVEYEYTADPIKKTCVSSDIELVRVRTQEMNEKYYHVANLSKDNFHRLYSLQAKPEAMATNVGWVGHYYDPADPTSYNIAWYVSPTQILQNLGKEITYVAQYVDGAGDVRFEMTFKAQVPYPTVNVSALKITDYWYYNGTGVRHNVAVPTVGAVDPALCTFVTNINNALKNKNKILDVSGLNGPNYTYEYVFAKDQKQMSKATGYKISVSLDGKELNAKKGATTEVIARITDHSATVEGDFLEVLDTKIGKELLNKGDDYLVAKVQLIIRNACGTELKVKGLNDDSDYFDVHLLRPISAAAVGGDKFIDGVDFGKKGTLIDVKLMAKLFDWRQDRMPGDFTFTANANYYKYYDVRSIKPNLAAIKVKDLEDGNGNAITTVPSTLKLGYVADAADLANHDLPAEVKTEITKRLNNANGQYGVIYYNNNGNNLSDDFVLQIPVTITYKWGEIVDTVIDVPVVKTDSI
ncbi:MAG: hypothetical protein Q4E10_03395, partial [Porphyromonas sp.]|nr:hypothetical protein [Porphyromonas sp.]